MTNTTTTLPDEQVVRDLVTGRIEALRTGDATALCGGYAPDAVVFNLAPPLAQERGAANDVARQQAWFDEKGGRVWADVRDLQILVSGDLAVATALQSMGAPPESPQPFTLWYRSTLVFRRTPEGWRIVHEHESTPFHMDGSLRAAVDLTP